MSYESESVDQRRIRKAKLTSQSLSRISKSGRRPPEAGPRLPLCGENDFDRAAAAHLDGDGDDGLRDHAT